MDPIYLIVFIAIEATFVIVWYWASRKISRLSEVLEHSLLETEAIVEEVRQVSRDLITVTNELEEARNNERTCPKNRRAEDRQDN